MLVKSKVKYIQSLSHKKQRDDHGVFIAEGPKIINELLNQQDFEPVELYALKKWGDENPPPRNITTTEVDEVLLSRISFLSTPNQVLGIFKMREPPPFSPNGKISLLLDGIQDPGNLGTIIRCADWFGIEQVMCSADSVDVYNPKTVQSTMGSIARVKVSYGNLEETIKQFPDVKIYAATLDGEDVNSIRNVKEAMVLVGNEAKGIREHLLKLPNHRITITRKGNAESLNAAVATAIILHAITA